jgi:hypothetical protein
MYTSVQQRSVIYNMLLIFKQNFSNQRSAMLRLFNNNNNIIIIKDFIETLY